jgi:opacity protein-like surface antigen
MNRTILLLVCLLTLGCNSKLSAQITFVGASANYGSWIKEIGASVYGIYSVSKRIDIVPNATYFLPHEVIIDDPLDVGTVKYTWWTINFDGHYVLFEKSVFHIFGLMGLNFTNETKIEDYKTQGTQFNIKTNTTKLGLNVGAGVQFPLSKFFIPFSEIKYTLGERHQGVVSLGVLVRIAPDRVREEME